MSATATATVFVNDRPHALASGATVADLLRELELAERKGVAVAVNGAVVPRGEWTERVLAADDRVLVIQATQGG
jgi:sulfur carrier protein